MTKLVYGFTIPMSIWKQISQGKVIETLNNINESSTIINRKIDQTFNFWGYGPGENDQQENILIGLDVGNLSSSNIVKLPINEVNSFLNNHIEELQETFSKLFKPIITDWAILIKNIADKVLEDNKNAESNEPIEIPDVIEIPEDLRVEWYCFNY